MNPVMNFSVPLAVNSLESYVQTVNRYPILTLEEEQTLARDWRDRQDVESARKLVLSHLRLVVGVARNYLGYGLPHADLIQEGNIGLMKAVKRFDPDRGVRLVSFALHWIRAEIHEYVVRNWRLVKIATTKAQRKLFFNLRSMKTGMGSLTESETQAMAATLGVRPEEVREMETRLSGGDIALEPTLGDEEDRVSPIAYLEAPNAEPAEQLASREIERLRHEGLQAGLDGLDPRSRRIIESRWLGGDTALTLHQLADEFGVSAERIRQIETQAMKKIRLSITA
jgi:RNA polymerase sigma-32 factor